MRYEPFYCNDTTTIDDIIEHILIRLNDDYAGGCLSIYEFCQKRQGFADPILAINVRAKMYKYDVAKPCEGAEQSDYSVALTAKGSQFAKKGEWKNYLELLEQEKTKQHIAEIYEIKRQEEAHQVALESAKATIESAKYAKSSSQAAWFAGLIAILPIIITIIQYNNSKSTDEEIASLKLQLKSLSQQLQEQKAIISISQHKIDSLIFLERTQSRFLYFFKK